MYKDSIHTIRKLPDDIAGKVFKAILAFVNGEDYIIDDFIVEVVFEPIKQQLTRDLVKYEDYKTRQSKNGSMGGRPPKKAPDKTEEVNPKNPGLNSESQKSLRDKESASESVSESESESESEKPKEKVSKPKKASAPKPLNILFRESEIFDVVRFQELLNGTAYESANVELYHEKMLNWSDSKNEKKINWLATAKNWMNRDMTEGKFIDKGFKPPNSRAKSNQAATGGNVDTGSAFQTIDRIHTGKSAGANQLLDMFKKSLEDQQADDFLINRK